MQYLSEKYGEQLFSLRVLLIHAGGQSQRMPSASVLGKIFSPIPKGENSMYQMLDLKLAMYLPFLPMMGPGIFVACADDFLLYDLGKQHSDIKFANEGFTALAHPSSLAIGTGHGVYVIRNADKLNSVRPVETSKCERVLQKPSEGLMYEAGAVLSADKYNFPAGADIPANSEFVYTDSSFFFAHDVTRKFLEYMKTSGPLACEIDAYGDFLQALGPKATPVYVENVSNVSNVTSNLQETRLSIYKTLRDTDLTLLVMNASKFIHIGTTREYINHFCCDVNFQSGIGLGKDVFNLWSDKNCVNQDGSGDVNDCPVSKKYARLSDTVLGCTMHSILPHSSYIAETAVLEYCHFSIPVTVGQSCILSNCEYDCRVKMETPRHTLQIPNNLFIHTVPVSIDNQTKYTTVIFDVKDSLKKVAVGNDVKNLAYLGKRVEDYAAVCNIQLTKIAPSNEDHKAKVNLWFASLFPVVDTMSESLMLALHCVDAVKTDNTQLVSLASMNLLSMAAVLRLSDLDSLLKYRKMLYSRIKAEHS